jgi:hypothetical protein
VRAAQDRVEGSRVGVGEVPVHPGHAPTGALPRVPGAGRGSAVA